MVIFFLPIEDLHLVSYNSTAIDESKTLTLQTGSKLLIKIIDMYQFETRFDSNYRFSWCK